MTNNEFRVMLVLSASPYLLTGLQVKRVVGGFFFPAWSVLFDCEGRGWVRRQEPAYWEITELGRRILAQDLQRRSEWA